MDKPKPKTRLQQIRDKFAETQADDALENLYEAPTRNNLITVLKASIRPQAHALATRIEQCRPGRKTRCKLAICPSCGPLIQRKEKIYLWQKLITHNKGVMPLMHDLSFVTVDGFALTSLDSNEIIAARNSFHSSLKNCRDRRLSDTGWIGLMDMGLGDQSAIHGHFIVHHPGRSRKEVRSELKAVFCDDRAVCVSEWHPNTNKFQDNTRKQVEAGLISLNEANLDNVTTYITKLGIKPPKEAFQNTEGRRAYKVGTTVDQIADRLIKLSVMRGKNLEGARIKLGITGLKDSSWVNRNRTTLQVQVGDDSFEHKGFRILDVVNGMYRKLMWSQERLAKDRKDQEKRLKRFAKKANKDCSPHIVDDSNEIGEQTRGDSGACLPAYGGGNSPIPSHYGSSVNRIVTSGTNGGGTGTSDVDDAKASGMILSMSREHTPQSTEISISPSMSSVIAANNHQIAPAMAIAFACSMKNLIVGHQRLNITRYLPTQLKPPPPQSGKAITRCQPIPRTATSGVDVAG